MIRTFYLSGRRFEHGHNDGQAGPFNHQDDTRIFVHGSIDADLPFNRCHDGGLGGQMAKGLLPGEGMLLSIHAAGASPILAASVSEGAVFVLWLISYVATAKK
ncbi:hypothetical protein DT075_00265 [Bacillus licheniformis]|nr:hypothetical protein DT075_00265 [Bacillus licheniformis]